MRELGFHRERDLIRAKRRDQGNLPHMGSAAGAAGAGGAGGGGSTAAAAASVTEVDNLQGIYPLKDEWVFGCSLKTRLADQTKTQQLKWLWSKDSMNSTINQRLVEQTQEINFKLEGSGGSTLGDTLRKQYLSSSDE